MVSKVMIDTIQAYPLSQNMREMKIFVGIWGFRRTFIPTWHSASACTRGTRGSKLQVTFEKAETLVKQIKALDTSHRGLTFKLDVSVTPEGMVGHYGKDNRRREDP